MDFLDGFNIGMLYAIVVSATTALISFMVAGSIGHRRRYFGNEDQAYMRYLSHFWAMMGFMWLFFIVHTYGTWSGNQALDKIFYIGFLILFGIQMVYLFLYLLSVLFRKYTFSPFLLFLSLLLPAVFLFFTFIDGLSYGGITGWGGLWLLPDVAGVIMRYALFVPLMIMMVLIGLREIGYFLFNKLEFYNKKVLYTLFPLGTYLLVILPDVIGIASGWIRVLLRISIIGVAFVTYLIYSGRKDIQFDYSHRKEEEYFKKSLVRRPLLVKSSLFNIFVSVLPLAVVATLLVYSIHTVFISLDGVRGGVYSVEVRQQIIILAVLISVVSFFVSIILARTMTVRLKLLYNGTREISRGNFDFRIKDIGGNDEIMLLGGMFNSVSEYLKRYQVQIQEYSANLEEEVEEQTKELQEKTQEADALAKQQKVLFEQLKTSSSYIIDEMGDGVLVLDDKMVVNTVNKSFLEKFNCVIADVQDKDLEDVSVLGSYPEIVTAVNELHTQKKELIDVNIELKPPLNGTVTCRITPVKKDNGEVNGTILVWRIENPQWGVVLDSQTRQPVKLAMVRLVDQRTNKLIDTEVTDPQGRFGFFVGKGQFYVTVMRDGYHFPSSIDEGYHGEVITVENKDEGAIKSVILMDPMVEKMESFDIGGDTESVKGQEVAPIEQSVSTVTLKTVEELEKENTNNK